MMGVAPQRASERVMRVSQEHPMLAFNAGERAPEVQLIDARTIGLGDEPALREHARGLSADTGAPFTSRSYSFPLALLAWHTAPVGCDIEHVAPCDEAFADSIRTPEERAAAAAREAVPEDADRDRCITSLWSSKEALAKALGDALDYDPRRLEGPGAWPDGRSGALRAATLDVADGYVAWLCWRAEGC
jgi:hypothetical protein